MNVEGFIGQFPLVNAITVEKLLFLALTTGYGFTEVAQILSW